MMIQSDGEDLDHLFSIEKKTIRIVREFLSAR